MENMEKNMLSDIELEKVVGGNDGMGVDAMNVTTEDWADTVMVVNNAAGANVRTAPGTEARILKTLTDGTKVTINGKTSNGWYRISTSDPQYGGECAGYISGNLLTMNYSPSVGPGYGPGYGPSSAPGLVPGRL